MNVTPKQGTWWRLFHPGTVVFLLQYLRTWSKKTVITSKGNYSYNQISDFSLLGASLHVVSRALHQLPDFPRLAPVTWFPALSTSYMISRALHQLHDFPRFAPVTWFPALSTSQDVFPRLASIACFPALGRGYRFSWTTIIRLPAPGTRLNIPVFELGNIALFCFVWHQLIMFPTFPNVLAQVPKGCF